MRRHYSVGLKLRMVADITAATNHEVEPISLRKACKDRKITLSMFFDWRDKIIALLSSRRSIFKMHPGRPSSINFDTENLLMEWLVMKREHGTHVNYDMLVLALGQLDAVFRHNTEHAQRQVVRRLALRNKYVYRASTHTAQRPPADVRAEAQQFVTEVVPRLASSFYGRRDKDFIINMDQTPIFFSFGSNVTLELMGSRSVNILGSPHKGSTSRATCFLSVTASGKMLDPMLVFKGTENGLISRQLRTYPIGAVYATQPKAWCDKRVMLRWVNDVLGPYVQDAPPDVRPVLLLDKFACHTVNEVVDLIFAMGIEIIYIPGGCTSLAQPLDVGINKPFRDRIRRKWQEWMLREKAAHGEHHIPKVPRELVAQWSIETNNEIDENIGQNAWKHAPFNYFEIEE